MYRICVFLALTLSLLTTVTCQMECPDSFPTRDMIRKPTNESDPFAYKVEIKPKIIKAARDPLDGLFGATTYVTLKGNEKYSISRKDKTKFLTNMLCIQVRRVRNIVVTWFIQNKKVHSKKELVPIPRGLFFNVCIRLDDSMKTVADNVKIQFRRTKKDGNEGDVKSIMLVVCTAEEK